MHIGIQTAAAPRLRGLAGLKVRLYAPLADEVREERDGLHGGEFAPEARAWAHYEAVEVVLRGGPARGDEGGGVGVVRGVVACVFDGFKVIWECERDDVYLFQSCLGTYSHPS